MRRAARRITLFAVAVCVALATVLGGAVSAQAHNYLVSSTPKSGETLTALPAAFSVTTNGPLLDLSGTGAGFALQVRDANGKYYGDGCVSVKGSAMSVKAALGAPGKYTVIWQAVSTDGHTVSDEFPFTWAPSSAATVTTGTRTPATCGGKSGGAAPVGTPAQPAAAASANLGDVLWIGGIVVALGLAVGVTLLVAGRRRKA